ncbi:ABC-2 family transporter protein [Paenibacillus thiaminolyticus]|uniref:ABC transporter permease n=1 Tax=Paenibacillus thiaminolyticus TaxID=49283 RepID=UPI0035A7092C
MKTFWIIVKNNMLITLAYRWNIMSSIVLMIIQMIVGLFVWLVIIDQSGPINGYYHDDMVTYFLLGAFISVIFSSSHFFRLSSLVRNGVFNMYLIRPYSFLADSAAQFLGSKIIDALLTLMLTLLFLATGLATWPSLNILGLFLFLSNFLLLFMFGAFLSCLSFWLIQMWPLKPLYNAMMAILGGNLYPLDLLPDIWFRVINFTPFPLLGYVNTKLLQGKLEYHDLQYYVLLSFCWLVVFSIGYKWLFMKGLRKYEGVNA